MKVETGTYPMVGIIPDGQWRPDNEAAVLERLNQMIMPSILQDCFEQGQRIRSLMHDSANWIITRDREPIDQVGYVHDCAECRESREGVVSYMREHDDAWMFVAVVHYNAVIA